MKERWRIRHQGGDVAIQCSSRSSLLILVVFAGILGIIWALMDGLETVQQTISAAFTSPAAGLRFILYNGPLLLPVAGLYAIFALLFNSRRIEVANGRLRAYDAPFPVPGRIKLEPPKMERVFARKSGDYFELVVKTKEGRSLILASGVPGKTEATAAVSALEMALSTGHLQTAEAGNQQNQVPVTDGVPDGCWYGGTADENQLVLPPRRFFGMAMLFVAVGIVLALRPIVSNLSFDFNDVASDAIVGLFWLLAGLIVLMLTYRGLVLLLSRIIFIIGSNQLRTERKPLPWFGQKSYDLAGLQDAYLKKVSSHTNKSQIAYFSVIVLEYSDGESKVIHIPEMRRTELEFLCQLLKRIAK